MVMPILLSCFSMLSRFVMVSVILLILLLKTMEQIITIHIIITPTLIPNFVSFLTKVSQNNIMIKIIATHSRPALELERAMKSINVITVRMLNNFNPILFSLNNS